MKSLIQSLALVAVLGTAGVRADVVVGLDPAANWLGYMNVFNLPSAGGAFQFGSGWGTADLRATFSGNELTLAPNTIGDPNEYWYIGGGKPGAQGNKIMDANFYIEPPAGTLNGQTVTFSGKVVENTLTSAHTAVAFIKDFAPDYSTFTSVTAPLVNGVFSISLTTNPDPNRHVQYGFTMNGVNVWATDVAPFGVVRVQPAPPPAPNPDVTVDPKANWQGFLTMRNLPPPNGDGAIFRQEAWPTADLKATFDGAVLKLAPNSIIPPFGLADPDYYRDDESGNKIMEALMYVETPPGALAGKTVTFSGKVVSNTFTNAHNTVAFIRDYTADLSSFVEATTPVTSGNFSVSLPAINDPARRIRYGFRTTGVNVWFEYAEPFGNLQVTAVVLDPFVTWIGTFDFSGLPGADLSKAGDPDRDGLNNLAEFALNGNPASARASGKVRSGVETVGAGKALVLTLPVRGTPVFSGAAAKFATADKVIYTVEGSDNLAAFDRPVVEISPALTAGLPALDPGWSYRSFQLDGTIGGATPRGPRGFLRARIQSEP